MKRLLPLLLLSFACNSKPKEQPLRSVKELDSLIEIQKANYVPPKDEFKDTVGVAEGPIKVISAKLFKEEYSNRRGISVTYKNVSNKNIDGIRFHWLTNGTWGIEDAGRYTSLKTDELLRKGQTQTTTWEIHSENKKSCMAWPHEVVFSDGSKWTLGHN